MSRGKYSPSITSEMIANGEYTYNAYGETPEKWDPKTSTVPYNQITMFGNYDSEGFDSYGYSGFDLNGDYVGIGEGIDRFGYTELNYLDMSDDDWEDVDQYCGVSMTKFERNK